MKQIIISIWIALLTLPVFAQQQMQAKVVLDKTAATFEKAGGIRAEFNVTVFNKSRMGGQSAGVIELKGEKFVLKTDDGITWFDGKTQWSYLRSSDEVNISNLTGTELQGLNPYALLQIYRHGFDYKIGSLKNFGGKPVYEVVLTATDKKRDLSRIVLYVSKETYQPLFIMMEQRDKSRSEITVTGYQTGLKYADGMFVFDKKQYPHAEVIDLR